MNEPPINQLYCTHCTYGTSAFYRADDARRDQVFEYTTRASSVEQNRTHELFQLVERYIKFQLPGDTPASDMLRYTAETCPWQRLAYFPSISRFRVLTRSCYRQTDTRKRPGSYFAHVLLSESNNALPSWTAIDGLKLWGSPGWIPEDSPRLPFDLPKAAPLSDWPGYAEKVNDDVLFAFLSSPPEGAFPSTVTDDEATVIPQRWRKKSVAERRQLLIDLLGTVAQLNIERHEKLVIAVEPGLAALLFYGILRLLPAQGLAESISFSTYESHLEIPTTTLAACSFSNPAVTDLLPDAYRGGAINTFNGRRGQMVRSAQSTAASYLVETWSKDEAGRRAVESLLEAAVRAGITRLKELEELISANRLVGQLLSPDASAPLAEQALPRSIAAKRHLQEMLAADLSQLPQGSSRWNQLTAVPGNSLLLVGLLGAHDAPSDAQTVAEQICLLLRPEERARLLSDPGITAELKTANLSRFIIEYGELPSECSFFWNRQPPAGVPLDLAVRVLRKLDAGRRNSLLTSLVRSFDSQEPSEADVERYKTAVRAVFAAAGEDEGVLRVLAVMWPPSCHENFVLALLQDPALRAPLLRVCPVDESVLSRLVPRLLNELPCQTTQFRNHLNILKAASKFLEPGRQKELVAWKSIADLFTRLGQNPQKSGSWLKLSSRNSKLGLLDGEHEDLGNWVQAALPEERFPEDYQGKERAKVVADIARAWLAPAELPADFVRNVASAICLNEPALLPAPTRLARKRLASWANYVRRVVGVALLLTACALGYAFWPQFRQILSLSKSDTDSELHEPDALHNETPSRDIATSRSNHKKAGGSALSDDEKTQSPTSAAHATQQPRDQDEDQPPAEPKNHTATREAGPAMSEHEGSSDVQGVHNTQSPRRLLTGFRPVNDFAPLPKISDKPNDNEPVAEVTPAVKGDPQPDADLELTVRGLDSLNTTGDDSFILSQDTHSPPVRVLASRPPQHDSDNAVHSEALCVFRIGSDGRPTTTWRYQSNPALRDLQVALRSCAIEVILKGDQLRTYALCERPKPSAEKLHNKRFDLGKLLSSCGSKHCSLLFGEEKITFQTRHSQFDADVDNTERFVNSRAVSGLLDQLNAFGKNFSSVRILLDDSRLELVVEPPLRDDFTVVEIHNVYNKWLATIGGEIKSISDTRKAIETRLADDNDFVNNYKRLCQLCDHKGGDVTVIPAGVSQPPDPAEMGKRMLSKKHNADMVKQAVNAAMRKSNDLSDARKGGLKRKERLKELCGDLKGDMPIAGTIYRVVEPNVDEDGSVRGGLLVPLVISEAGQPHK